MILLVTDTIHDRSSKKVRDWLSHYSANFISVNNRSIANFTFLSNKIDAFSIRIDGRDIFLKDVKSVYFRRMPLKILDYGFSNALLWKDIEYANDVWNFLNQEKDRCLDLLYIELSKKKKIGDYFSKEVNKMNILTIAQSVELNIPKTLITTSKTELIQFKIQNKKIITKCIYESVSFCFNGVHFAAQTKRVSNTMIAKMHIDFMPTLFQEEITKKFEIRVFYLLGECYSMAIFSQKNKKTRLDFRQYDELNPNRFVPFKLPKNIEEKIRNFMKKTNLTYGSLDFIYTPSGEFVFLEVNPEGIFEMVSIPCNYNLEKLIAEKLIDFDNEENEKKSTENL